MLIFSRGFLRKDELGVFCYVREGRGSLQERKSCGWAQPGMNSSRARSCEQGATADGISTSSPFCLGEELLSKLIMFVWESKKRSEIQNQESLKRKRPLKDKNTSFHFYFFFNFWHNCSIWERELLHTLGWREGGGEGEREEGRCSFLHGGLKRRRRAHLPKSSFFSFTRKPSTCWSDPGMTEVLGMALQDCGHTGVSGQYRTVSLWKPFKDTFERPHSLQSYISALAAICAWWLCALRVRTDLMCVLSMMLSCCK